MEEKLNNFIDNLSDDDIDLYNKLGNMYGSEINNDILFNILASNKVLQDENMFKTFQHMCELSPYNDDMRKEYIDTLKSNKNICIISISKI